jgi:hypothetical protein
MTHANFSMEGKTMQQMILAPPVRPEVLAPAPFGPRRPNFFQRHWPVLSRSAEPVALIAALVAAVVAAIAIPPTTVGVGWLITGGVAAAGLIIVGVRGARAGSLRTNGEKLCWAAATVALLSVGTFRSAGWLFVLCVLTAIGCAALTVAGGRTVFGLLLAPVTLVASMFRALPWAGRATRLRPSNGENAMRIAAAVIVGLVLLLVFGLLFAGADPAFGEMLSKVVPDVDASTAARWIFVGGIVGLGVLGGTYLLANPATLGDVTPPPTGSLRRVEWTIPVGALVLLFGAFVGVQVTVLFGDRDYVLRTVGLTFAEYARRGFGQLCAITILTLAVIAVTARKAPRENPGDRRLLRILLGALTVGALVVVASALWRMSVYEEAYGFTRLRLLVSAFEVWLGVLLVLFLVAGVRLRAGWLPRFVVATGVATLLGLAVLNPDGFIAERNLARYHQSGHLDVWYLGTLSPDAAPALDKLDGPDRRCALTGIAESLRDEPVDWRGWNLGRARSEPIVADVPPDDWGCTRRR